ncbi:hypothetical protein [Aliidongia dinghuensis]|uniref:hypothetical protein n=1 Tax=Aliidongia dinghuensis TaxID=1867774 RepID=UPI00166B1BAD|nr:hypothetical protein [Aliidongia dinghuensis]
MIAVLVAIDLTILGVESSFLFLSLMVLMMGVGFFLFFKMGQAVRGGVSPQDLKKVKQDRLGSYLKLVVVVLFAGTMMLLACKREIS